MATQTADGGKTEEKVTEDLKRQMADMSLGFEDIVRAREEAKKKLEEDFEHVYQRIEENKHDCEKQSDHMHQILGEFQQEFDENLNSLTQNLHESIEAETKMFMLQEMELCNNRCEDLEKMLAQETKDRIKDTKDTLDPVRHQISDLQNELDFETKYTVKMEKRLLKDVANNIEEQHNVILKEKKERDERLTDIYDMLDQEVQLQNKFFDQFEEKARKQFDDMINEVQLELDSRLTHQDNILKDFKFFVDRFGQTMKHIGKDV
eukprot:CAMPEP_0197006254 /NCGR_PEP_ID=MMETSP1380-20130617/33758_1 /TAXON_ID=5936 /ORGANISM="Euplotes crassus, Strain CT5" /LENGTH=262 /DNA_ID=CAMNT_0042425759 /DNA_START=31 /DNA_END=819 /DNA_ORIENTATION=+